MKEKIAIRYYQWQIKKGKALFKEEKKADKGVTSFVLGIVSVALMILPYGILLGIPAAILAIIFGNQAKKIDKDDRQARTGVVLGWVALGLVVLTILLVVALLASGGFWI